MKKTLFLVLAAWLLAGLAAMAENALELTWSFDDSLEPDEIGRAHV